MTITLAGVILLAVFSLQPTEVSGKKEAPIAVPAGSTVHTCTIFPQQVTVPLKSSGLRTLKATGASNEGPGIVFNWNSGASNAFTRNCPPGIKCYGAWTNKTGANATVWVTGYVFNGPQQAANQMFFEASSLEMKWSNAPTTIHLNTMATVKVEVTPGRFVTDPGWCINH